MRRYVRIAAIIAVIPAIAGVGCTLVWAAEHAKSAPTHPAAKAAESEPSESADAIWSDLLTGNKRFMADKPQARELVVTRRELVKGQHPKVIILTCSDSRVSPELIFDKNLGEVFVVRTAGNVADKVALGSIEYAAEHLHSSVLVVLGHEKCGAVAAAASGEPMPTENLAAIVDRIAPALKKVKAANKEQLAALGVAANVNQSAADIAKQSPVVQKETKAGELTVIKAVYHLESGEVTKL